MRRLLFAALLGVAVVSAQPHARATLDLYPIDVEGGNATLIVSPAGESMLIDAANGGPAAVRDADARSGRAVAGAGAVHNGPAFRFKVSAKDDGAFTVTNARNSFTKSDAARDRR